MAANTKHPYAALLETPHPFAYTDWVVNIPVPQIPRDVPYGQMHELDQVILKRLVRAVESRTGRNRCFYEFLVHPSQYNQKRPSQIRVTGLYAFYQVKHWPGAFAQLEWTSFVFANIEYDNMIRIHGAGINLMLPILPMTALPTFQAMKKDQDQLLARICSEQGKTIGEVVEGQMSLYANGGLSERGPLHRLSEHDPALQVSQAATQRLSNIMALPLPNPSQQTPDPEPISEETLKANPDPSTGIEDAGAEVEHVLPDAGPDIEQSAPEPEPEPAPSASASASAGLDADIDLSESPNNWTVDEVVVDKAKFEQTLKLHGEWIQKATYKMQVYMTRHVCRSAQMQAAPWEYCWNEARRLIMAQADTHLQNWHEKFPQCAAKQTLSTGNWLEKQLKCLLMSVAAHHRIPPELSPEVQAQWRRKHYLIATGKQRQLLQLWAKKVKGLAEAQHGLRYRYEKDFVWDLWTGKLERRGAAPADGDRMDVD
ncbi:hypothetical protein ABEF95_014071 [Exophiala dermatitidis]